MEFALGFIVLAAALAALGYPLYAARPLPRFAAADAPDDLTALRDGLYATLRDLDLDYQLGKLDAADYTARRETYLRRAALVLKQLDAAQGREAAALGESAEIEGQVAALRRPSLPSPALPPASGSAPLACPTCGRAYQPGDRFCRQCGSALA